MYGHAVLLLHLLRQVGEAFGADDDIELRPVGVAEVLESGVAAEAGEDADAEPVEERQHPPEVAGNIVFADQIDVVVGDFLRLGGPDDVFEQDLARQAVADVLVADEAGGIDRNDRNGDLLLGRLADRLDIVAGHGGDAGGVDEDRLCLGVAGRQFHGLPCRASSRRRR